MLNKKLLMNCDEGFHIRPAQVLMEKVTPFDCRITIKKTSGDEADAKSILGLMSLGIEKGETVEVETNGPDEAKAMEVIEKLFAINFEE